MKAKITLFIISIIYAISFMYYAPWQSAVVEGGDTFGYYLYLPAAIIYHDLDSLNQTVNAVHAYNNGFTAAYFVDNNLGIAEAHAVENGKQVIKYTMGVSVCNLPAFMIAHSLTKISSQKSDGFALIYRFLVLLSGLIYVLLALFILRKALKDIFDDLVISIGLAAISLGTNLYYFAVLSPAMSHTYLFFWYALLIYATIKFYKKLTLKHAIMLGLSLGMIVLIRPAEIYCVSIPLLYGIQDKKSFLARIGLVRTDFPKILTIVILCIIPMVPQMLYWYHQTGSLIHDSYPGEHFNFLRPQVYNGLFQFKNGWLAYSPVMSLSLVGAFFLFKERKFLLPAVMFFCVHVVVIYSWWCWTYINGFGSRPMIEAYPLLSIPFCYTVRFCTNRNLFLKLLLMVGVLLCILLNIFNTYQFNIGILYSEDANSKYFLSILGKTSLSKNDLIVYDTGELQPDQEDIAYSHQLFLENISDTLPANNIQDPTNGSNIVYKMSRQNPYSPNVIVPVQDINAKEGDWIKMSTKAYRYEGMFGIYRNTRLVASFERGDKILKWKAMRIDNKIYNENNSFWGGKDKAWQWVSFYTQVPELKTGDILKVYLWSNEGKDILVDSIKAEVWYNFNDVLN